MSVNFSNSQSMEKVWQKNYESTTMNIQFWAAD